MTWKRTSLTLIVSLLLLQPLRAQDSNPQLRNTIGLTLSHLVEHTMVLSYERVLPNTRTSLVLSLGFTGHDESRGERANTLYGFQEEIQLRRYLIPVGKSQLGDGKWWKPSGLYVGGYALHRYAQRRSTVGNWQNFTIQTARYNNFSAGFLLGAQFILADRLALDAFGGAGFKYCTNIESYSNLLEPGFAGIAPKLGLRIAFAF